MTTRILPRDEWHRLPAESEIPANLQYHRPEDVQIVVVEHNGQIVATWAVLTLVQLEGVWIAPEHRKRGRVAQRLLAMTLRVARERHPSFAMTGATSPEVAHLLTAHLGAQKVPMDTYVVPLRDFACRLE